MAKANRHRRQRQSIVTLPTAPLSIEESPHSLVVTFCYTYNKVRVTPQMFHDAQAYIYSSESVRINVERVKAKIRSDQGSKGRLVFKSRSDRETAERNVIVLLLKFRLGGAK